MLLNAPGRVTNPAPRPAPIGQPYGSDALARMAQGNTTGVVKQDAIGRYSARADMNRDNFGSIRPVTKPETPLGGIAPSAAAQGRMLGGMPQYRSPLDQAAHGTINRR